MNGMENTRLVERIFEAPGLSGGMNRSMKTNLLHLISILILAIFVLTPGQGFGARAARQAIRPSALAAPTQGTTSRVSVASDGSQGDSESSFPSISADGHYVAFLSLASNLVSRDTNGERDVFVHNSEARNYVFFYQLSKIDYEWRSRTVSVFYII